MLMRKFKNAHEGDTCIVMANGPKLVETPRELLDAYPTFGTNKIYLIDEFIDDEYDYWQHGQYEGFVPTYWISFDRIMILECIPDILDYPVRAKFVPREYPVPDAVQMRMAVGAAFSINPESRVIMGGSVTYVALQLAAHMGFKRILIVGMDHEYTGHAPKDGALFIQEGPDTDHFHPHYFEEGHVYSRWAGGNLDNGYALAKMALTELGVEVFNLTPGGKMEVFERSTLDEWLPEKVSA